MRARGFTLVEMLVTIALMGLMAVICWRALSYVGAQRGELERESDTLAQLVRTFAQLERDLAERLPDAALPPRKQPGELPLAVALAPNELEILRYAPQAGVLRVRYRIEPGGLVRSASPVEDPGPTDVLLLPRASRLGFRVHSGGFWVVPGEPRVQPPTPATAVEFAIESDAGRYVKVLIL